MTLRLYLGACFFMVNALGHTQPHWKALGRGPQQASVHSIMADTLADRLIVCGDFNYYMNEEDTIQCCSVAQWRGTRWDTLAHPMVDDDQILCGEAWWLSRFNSRLYICGGGVLLADGTLPAPGGFLQLNEQTLRWQPLICPNPYYSSLAIVAPRETAGQPYIYLTGEAWSLCGFPEACVFRYDGLSITQWEPWAQIPSSTSNVVNYMFEYRDKVYVGGIIANPVGPGFKTLLRHNGTNWEEVPGYNGGLIKDISIYRDTLYFAGQFSVPGGVGGSGVAAFDGEQWFPLGDGLALPIAPQYASGHSLRWFHDELYVGGGFSHAGGIPANGFAKWNRRQWCSLPGFDVNSFDQPRKVNSMAVWRDSLYVEGMFTTLEGAPIRYLAQWIGGDAVTDCSSPVGIQEPASEQVLRPSPNPTSGRFNIIGLPANAATVELHDATGHLVLREKALGEEIDITGIASGLYCIVIRDRYGSLLSRATIVKR